LNISWHSNWMFFSSRLKIISSLFTYNWAVSNFSAHKLTSLWIENVSSSYIALMVVGKLNFLYLTVHLRILICNTIYYQDLFTKNALLEGYLLLYLNLWEFIQFIIIINFTSGDHACWVVSKLKSIHSFKIRVEVNIFCNFTSIKYLTSFTKIFHLLYFIVHLLHLSKHSISISDLIVYFEFLLRIHILCETHKSPNSLGNI
jgi:hypothetical protein